MTASPTTPARALPAEYAEFYSDTPEGGYDPDGRNYKYARTAGPYALTQIRRGGGYETERFTATLTKNGKRIGVVDNDGYGGSNVYFEFTREDMDDFVAFAHAVTAPDAIGAVDRVIDRLLTIDAMNRKRTTIFVLPGDDFWATGQYRQVGGSSKADKASVKAWLDKTHPDALVWDKTVSDFR